MRKTALAVSMLLLLGSAYGFSASLETVDRTASSANPGKFVVHVQNDGFESKIFHVSVSPYSSWFYTESAQMVEEGENHTFELIVTPPNDAIQQNYRFDATVSAGDETESFTEYFTVQREDDLIITGFSSDRNSYRPGNSARLQVEVLNTAASRVENYRIRAEMLDSSTEKKGLPLSPSTSGRLALNLPIPGNAAPGERTITISILRNGETRQTVNQTITVQPLEKIKRGTDTDNRILFYTKTSTIRNAGNSRTQASINQSLPDYLKPITSFSKTPDRTYSSDDTTTYSWSFDLAPGETATVSRTTDYWIPGSILALLLAGLVILKKVRTQVSFEKKARKTEEGVTVHIELENRSSEPVKDVKVTDFVPDIASVSEEFPMARPVIRKTSNGTRLSWEINELEPGSQRVFEYTIKPMFEVEGGVELPEARLEAGSRKIIETGTAEAEFQPEDT